MASRPPSLSFVFGLWISSKISRLMVLSQSLAAASDVISSTDVETCITVSIRAYLHRPVDGAHSGGGPGRPEGGPTASWSGAPGRCCAGRRSARPRPQRRAPTCPESSWGSARVWIRPSSALRSRLWRLSIPAHCWAPVTTQLPTLSTTMSTRRLPRVFLVRHGETEWYRIYSMRIRILSPPAGLLMVERLFSMRFSTDTRSSAQDAMCVPPTNMLPIPMLI
jgi:hypothetical protein